MVQHHNIVPSISTEVSGNEALIAMDRRSGQGGSFTSDIWLPEFRAVRALPGFVDFIEKLGMVDYWRAHGMPDVCNGSAPEVFCRFIAESIGI